MAAPNIVGVTNINANTTVQAATTVASNVVVNATNSNSVYKINSIMLSNYSASNITANVDFLRGGTGYYIGGAIVVPANSTLIASGKDTAFYMIEGDALRTWVSANSSAHITVSYEVIS